MANWQKLFKFNGDGKEDPVLHYRTCETIWSSNGMTDKMEWVVQFPANLRGVAIDWYSDANKTKLATWDELHKAFVTEFGLLRDDNEIVAEILSTKQRKNETVRAYSRHLKELLGKMDNKPGDRLKKRWFVDGLKLSLRRKMKIVPPTSYENAYNRAMDLESEGKTCKKKKDKSFGEEEDSEGSSSDEGSSKKVQALQKDMYRMMKEFKSMKGSTSKNEEVWYVECKEEGHTKGTFPKKAFCDICQVLGHSTKECPYNMKTRGNQVLFTQEQSSPSATAGTS
ncbi:uncharacterized protein LOC131041010 [Cryptomeria japonica]|uniref:uncharacterized protein LOC131041010 n=1 Tax=Cryptomeria japonica TaxID=3369 RepID=UPI0025AC45B7|nr:uncharacterized protein LOC131041010 [Cryptomeria japonica]